MLLVTALPSCSTSSCCISLDTSLLCDLFVPSHYLSIDNILLIAYVVF
jgi:hypothetical protein